MASAGCKPNPSCTSPPAAPRHVATITAPLLVSNLDLKAVLSGSCCTQGEEQPQGQTQAGSAQAQDTWRVTF